MPRKKMIKTIKKELGEKGYTEQDFDGMEEEAIREMYDEIMGNKTADAETAAISDAIEENVDSVSVEAIDPSLLDFGDEKIVSLFSENEIDDEYIKIDGLRRVVRKVIGPIIDQNTVITQVNVGKYSGVSATFKISFLCENQNFGPVGNIVSYSDCGDCIPEYSADQEYGRYMAALAATRAEGRVYRKALGISLLCSEEVTDVPLVEAYADTPQGPSNATGPQIKAIKVNCEKKGISIEELFEDGESEETLTAERAKEILIKVNKMKEKHNG